MSGFGLVRRAGWAVADQVLSSGTNFALAALVARASTAAEFGAFALALGVYQIALGVTRALASEPLMVRHSHSDSAAARSAVAAATAASLAVGVLVAVPSLAVGLVFDGPLRAALTALAICLPGLMLQDGWRYAFFSRGHDRSAFLNDLVWALVMFPLVLAAIADGWGTGGFIIAWGGAALIAGAVGAVQFGAIPNAASLGRWWRGSRDLGVRYALEFAAQNGASQAAVSGTAGIAGIAAVGALRAGGIIMGPLNIVLLGIRLVAVPEGVRVLRAGSRPLRGHAARISLVLIVAVLGWGGAVQLLPDSVGSALLGDSWLPAKAILVPLTIAFAGSAATVGAGVGLRALAAARTSLRVQLLFAPITVSCVLVGSALGEAPGAAWGMALANWCGVALFWWQFDVACSANDAARRPTDVGYAAGG